MIQNILLAICGLCILFYSGWRVTTLLRKKKEKFFHGFWCWPLLWFAVVNILPIWECKTALFQGVVLLILLGMILDFFYYYGVKAVGNPKQQKLSAIWLIPFLFVMFRHYLVRGPEMVLPFYGEAVVWTNKVISPDVFYFLDPETESVPKAGEPYNDPNYSKAIFSPFSGEVVTIRKDGFVVLRSHSGEVEAAIGPLIANSINLEKGAEVFENQPLGLLDHVTEGAPGICLQVLKGGTPLFKEAFTGRHFGQFHQKALLKRNQFAVSEAKGRFQLRPK